MICYATNSDERTQLAGYHTSPRTLAKALADRYAATAHDDSARLLFLNQRFNNLSQFDQVLCRIELRKLKEG